MNTRQRTRNKRGEGEQLREDLVTAASELLDITGDAEGLSVRGVTGRAGVSHTALYLHFDDVEQLARAVKIRCFDALGEALASARDAAGSDPMARLRAMARAYLRYAREHPGHYALLYHAYRRQPADRPPVPEVLDAGMDTLRVLLDAVGACLDRGVDDEEVRDIAVTLWLALHGRVGVCHAMPWMPLTDEDRFLTLLIDDCLGLRRGSRSPRRRGRESSRSAVRRYPVAAARRSTTRE
jgi:AcrR family transcriptional regulator